jgi:isocitrate dehydrogenase
MQHGKGLHVPPTPIIPFIEGDGTGPDIWKASTRVFDAAVESAYKGNRKIAWMEVFAGEKATQVYGEHTWLPQETIEAFRQYLVGIKCPLSTPVNNGIRSLNVALRQDLDLYTCLRPIRYIPGTPSPMKHPEKINMVVFRENTEDVYTGIEWPAGSEEAKQILDLLHTDYPKYFSRIRFSTQHAVNDWQSKAELSANDEHWQQIALGLKPISKLGCERIMRAAIQYALKHKRKSVTIVHKANIMKFTEGSFRNWAYELAEKEFGNFCYTWSQWEHTRQLAGEERANQEQDAAIAIGTILVKDVLTDVAFQQVLTRPEEFDVIAALNLSGDYLSDSLATQIGGIGIAPGANINFVSGHAIFEAPHGTAPKYANQDKVNPSALILSGVMMMQYLGWFEAAALVEKGLGEAILNKKVTYDFARQMDDAVEIHCSEFANEIIRCM